MTGSTKYHSAPDGLRRCRHGQGGVSGRSRACPYGGPVTSSSDRMGVPPAERLPVAKPSLAADAVAGPKVKVVGKQEERRAKLIAELRAIRDEKGDDFSWPARDWADENGVVYYRIDGMTHVEHRLEGLDYDAGNELYLLTEQAHHRNYPKERWDPAQVPEVMTEAEIPGFLEEARKGLPQTADEFLAAMAQTPYWEDTSKVDEEAILKKFRNKTAQKKEVLSPQEVYFLASQSGSPQAKRMMAAFQEDKPQFKERARKAWREGSWTQKWKLFLDGRHHYPFKPVKPAQVWGLLTVEQTWKLAADGVAVP